MHDKEFIWVVGNDDNRIADGRDLRVSYLRSLGIENERDYESMHIDPVSFLEVLIGLSIRVAFLVSEEENEWAWNLIKNLNLDRMWDPLTPRKVDKIHERLDAVIWRTYSITGDGGFFPLVLPGSDQRNEEIWDQMLLYIEENRASYGL
jgi:hypothetical protein